MVLTSPPFYSFSHFSRSTLLPRRISHRNQYLLLWWQFSHRISSTICFTAYGRESRMKKQNEEEKFKCSSFWFLAYALLESQTCERLTKGFFLRFLIKLFTLCFNSKDRRKNRFCTVSHINVPELNIALCFLVYRLGFVRNHFGSVLARWAGFDSAAAAQKQQPWQRFTQFEKLNIVQKRKEWMEQTNKTLEAHKTTKILSCA